MKANLKLRAVHGRSCIWLSVLVFQYCFQLSASLIYWTAYVEVRYFDSVSNETVGSICECGMFGADSPLDSASGLLVLPNSDPLACSRNTTFTAKHQPWIALIKRGNCTYSQKIRAAQREGASAVVIYNIDGTGNNTDLMAHSGADDIAAIMVGNILGKEMANLVKNGSDVYVEIVVANPHGLWYSSTWVYALSFTFIGISTITMFVFAFLFIKRMYRNQQLRMQEREMKRENEKAIAKLEVRTLRTGDPEVESEEVSCVVCTDPFKHNEQVTVLPCRHLYHKKCIEPWLLEHPTCPMCKYHILKYKIDEESDEPSSSSSSSSGDTFCLAVIRTEQLHTSNCQTAETALGHPTDCDYREPEIQTPHIHENPAFEEEPEMMEHQDISSQH
ncbi:RING finger protein 148-like [Sinocyclocheilus rhinocerous]|uniref:RING finger protein 148-like n=1 Tax=Sinocyclocheilus rhinocerous TaxID=307959 RepID=UPI0007BA901E|nr:PREDICTED: RING finger protein 148-like [Sinocyclocheilus rhinocerous]